jgi:hypothetical protein
MGIKHILSQSSRSIKHKRIFIGIKYVDFFIDASNVTIQNGKTNQIKFKNKKKLFSLYFILL